MDDPIDSVARLATSATRQARRPYRYLTGDPTCLGFVRFLCVTMLLDDVAATIGYIRDGSLRDAGFALGVSVFLLVLLGPQLFRTAASTDRSPIGLSIGAKPDLFIAVDVALTLGAVAAIIYKITAAVLGHLPSTGETITLLGFPLFTVTIWAARDRDGGKGNRTLTKDLHRLLRRGPEAAGGHITRRPVPVHVDR